MIKNRKGSIGIDLILLLLMLLGLGAGAILGVDDTAVTATPDQVVHSGMISEVRHEISGGMDVTTVEFMGGISYSLAGYRHISRGDMCQIVRSGTGYDLQLK